MLDLDLNQTKELSPNAASHSIKIAEKLRDSPAEFPAFD
jgi:hypothetical protein